MKGGPGRDMKIPRLPKSADTFTCLLGIGLGQQPPQSIPKVIIEFLGYLELGQSDVETMRATRITSNTESGMTVSRQQAIHLQIDFSLNACLGKDLGVKQALIAEHVQATNLKIGRREVFMRRE